jgi:eukaryotic-like serine/threonine-protein kinase
LNLKRRQSHLILLILFAFLFESGCVKPPSPDDPPSTQKFITSFSFSTADNPGLSALVSAGGIADTILCYFPSGTNLTNLIPTIEFTGKSISPGNKVARNFTNPVAYEVTAEDGTVKKYIISSRFIPSEAREITAFNLRIADNPQLNKDIVGLVKSDSVLLEVPKGTDLSTLKPFITFKGAGISPANLEIQNFANPVTYRVTAEVGLVKTYIVKISFEREYGVIYIGAEDSRPGQKNNFYALDVRTGLAKWNYIPAQGIFIAGTAFNAGKLFVPIANSILSIDTVTHSTLWSFQAGGLIYSTPFFSKGILYFNCDDMYMYAVDAATGNLKWKFQQNTLPSGSGGGNYSSPTIVDDVVYFGSVDDYIYAVDAITGIMKWKALDTTVYTSGSHTQSSPVVSNGVLYIGQSNNAISAFNINDGSLKWHLNTGSLIFSSPTIVDGILYVGCADAKLYAVDASTGIIKWTFSSAKQIYNCPIVSNGVVFFGGWGANANGFYAVNAATGTLKWVYSHTGGFRSSPVVFDGVVFVGSDDNFLALDAESGALKWKFDAEGDSFLSSPLIVDKNGKVYNSTLSGHEN